MHRSKSVLSLALVAGCLLPGVMPAVAGAAPGDLDPTFGSGGIVTNQAGEAVDVAVQSDGKVVTAGSEGECSEINGDYVCHSEFLVARYTESGALDPTFGGGDGIVTTSFGHESQGASSVLIEPSGKILVGGTTFNESTNAGEFAVARYDSDGALDTSFGGGDGKVSMPVPGAIEGLQSWSGSMAKTSDGTIVLGGDAYVEGEPFTTWHLALAAFTAGGAVDGSFGSGGAAIGPAGQMYGLGADGNGRILAAGWSSHYDFAVTRFTADGSLDSSFGEGGIASLPLSSVGSKADDVLVQPDGKIVASGYGVGYAVARFDEDGAPDPSFGGGDGVVMTFFAQPCCGLGAAISDALQPDGRIVFAGQWSPDEDTFGDEWGIGRLYPNGLPDESFGAAGLVTQGFGGGPSMSKDASGVAIQPDGRIVAVGNTGSPNFSTGLLRLMGGGSSVPPPTHHLLIGKSGQGAGIVYGPDMLSCGANCGVDYEVGRSVEVNVRPEEGSSFTGWTTSSGNPGTCTGMTTPCEVVLTEDVELVAGFKTDPKPRRTLSVSKSGDGGGTVASTPSGIVCGALCEAEFDQGTEVTLTATPAPGSIFAGWTGGSCFGTGICRVFLGANTQVTAEFVAEAAEEEHAGQPGGGGAGASPPPPRVVLPSPLMQPATPKAPKPLRCRKGFKRKRVDGKLRCVRLKHHPGR